MVVKRLHVVGVKLASGDSVCDLEFADGIVCSFESSEGAHMVIDRLEKVVKPFGMRFAPSKCEVMLQDWTAPVPSLKLEAEALKIVENFTYLGSR